MLSKGCDCMNILVINGPNLNMLGIREPEIYGRETYADLCRLIEDHAEKAGVTVTLYQSNHEGDLVDAIHGYPGGFPEGQLRPRCLYKDDQGPRF